MKRVVLSMVALVGVVTSVGGGCKDDPANENPDLAKGGDMAVGSGDMAVVVDMSMRTPANGQVIVAEIEGTVYSATGPDGGIAPTPGTHALAAIATFPEFEPILGANDESNLTFLPTQGGCSVQTYDPLMGDLPESSASAGLITATSVNGSMFGISPPAITSPTPLPSSGAGIACVHATPSGSTIAGYGCAFTALDQDMSSSPWSGKLVGLSAFPTLPESLLGGSCPAGTSYISAGGFCVPVLIGNSLNIDVPGATGPFATGTATAKIPVTVPGGVTVSSIKVGATTLTLPSTPGTVALDALNDAFTTNEALEVSFTCTGTGAGSCTAQGSSEAAIVGLLATTSTAHRGGTAAATAKVAVAQCVASVDAGKITMSASQVTKLRAAAAGGSIQFVLARINAQVDSENSPRLIIRGAGRGQFTYINQ